MKTGPSGSPHTVSLVPNLEKCSNSLKRSLVSGLNATDKTPMYEMPLIFVFRGWGLGEHVFIGVLGDGILSLAFCDCIKF